MTTVSTAASTASNASIAQPQTLTSTDFLKILVAEFQGQDPTSPTDPTQFASQLVQFANLGQLENIDSAVQQPASSGLMQAASAFIGREVVTPGNQIGLRNGKATAISWTPAATDSYTAQVFNAAGQQVDTVALGSQSGGTLETFNWNPPSGTASGQYTVNIVNSQGVATGGLLEQGVVQSVALTSAGIALDLGNLVVSEGQVTSVAQPQSN
jgi:flagellar basal-body rod modification protein FlgD